MRGRRYQKLLAVTHESGVVYFVAFGGEETRQLIKIGITANLPQRLQALRSECGPYPTRLITSVPGDARLERLLLDRLAGSLADRVPIKAAGYGVGKPREIFRPTPEVLRVVGAAMRGSAALAEELARVA